MDNSTGLNTAIFYFRVTGDFFFMCHVLREFHLFRALMFIHRFHICIHIFIATARKIYYHDVIFSKFQLL
jgi:hypothetical protein